MSVRPLVESDLPQVVDLYWRHMRRRMGSAPPALRASFRELYFANPWVDTSFPPLVYEEKNGQVVGFLGAMVREMSAAGKPVRVAFGGNLVVDPRWRSKIAAPRLLQTFLAGPQDISLTDSANDISRHILERLEFRTIASLNIHWLRPLRPAHYSVHAASRVVGPMFSGALKLAAKPFCVVADRIAARHPSSMYLYNKPRLQGVEADAATLFQCFHEFRNGYAMWPQYDLHSLEWLLGYMGRRDWRGSLRKVLLRDENQKIVGWYVYYAKAGGVGEVVQVGGQLKSTQDVLDHLFWDALHQGVVGLHGVVDRLRMPDFSDKGCFFTCRGGWTIAYSRQPELMEMLDNEEICLTRLDGEWCLDPGE